MLLLHQVLVFVLFLVSRASCTKYVRVDATNGTDSEDCLEGYYPCQTVSFALSQQYDDVVYTLSADNFSLNTSIKFVERTSVTIRGAGDSYNDTIVFCSNKESGLSFRNSSKLRIELISLISCSFTTGVNDVNAHWYRDRAAIFFYQCTDITLYSIRVSNSSNATGLVLLDTGGQNQIINSQFDHNGWVGRGVHVHISETFAANQPAPSFNFQNCSIVNNSAVSDPNDTTSCIPLRRHEQTYMYGGGLCIVLQSNHTGVSIDIAGTDIISNEAKCGGGLFFNMEYASVNNSIQLTDCNIQHNRCPFKQTGFGGGIRIEHLTSACDRRDNLISIHNCNISENKAYNGGGLSISPIALNCSTSNPLNLGIASSEFVGNKAIFGAGIEITLLAVIVEGQPPMLNITNTIFTKNKIMKQNHQNGVGAVYTNKVPIKFHQDVTFTANHGSALAVVGTYIAFVTCNATFQENCGAKGGAIALLGNADIFIDNNSKMTFCRNKATLYGGAIYNNYIQQENLIAYFNCFVRPMEPFKPLHTWTATFKFIDNHATMSGMSIFSTSIIPCQVKDLNFVPCFSRWYYSRNNVAVNCTDEITTEPASITDNSMRIEATPGDVTSLNFSIFDDLHHDIRNQTVFAAHINNDEHNLISIDSQYSYISNQKIMLDGISGSMGRIHLHTTGNRPWHLHLNASLRHCPPGFEQSNDTILAAASSKCICPKAKQFNGIIVCNQATFESVLSHGYWIGILNVSEENDSVKQIMMAGLCPPRLCKGQTTSKSKSRDIVLKSQEDLNNLCENSYGVTCGQCSSTYGHAVNSDIPRCVGCKEGKLSLKIVQYILSVYLPLFVLFFCMIIFGIRLTTGPANAFIFYSQVISGNFNLDADSHIKFKRLSVELEALKKVYQLPYGLFNLEFIENLFNPFCVSTHLNALDVFQLDYGVALTPLVMILIVLLCLKLRKSCRRVTPVQVTETANSFLSKWKSGKYLLHAFAAFVLLSYTKLGLTSAYIIRSNPVYSANGYVILPNRVYFAGQYSMTDDKYVWTYFIPAVLVLAMNLLPPLFLLVYPVIWMEKCLIRCPIIWRRYPVDKVHILLDIFQGCYKDNRRFFAGFYFLFRYAINILYITTSDWIQRFMSQQIVCIVLALLVAVCWPYKKELNYLNYVDLLIFGNLSIINALSFYIYNKLHNHIESPEPILAFSIQYTLIFLPLLYMLAYLLWNLIGEKCRKCICKLINRHLIDNTDKLMSSCEGSHGRIQDRRPRSQPTVSEVRIEESEQENYEEAQNGDETLFERSRRRNTYKAKSSNSHSERASNERVTSCDESIQNSDSGTGNNTSKNEYSPLVPIVHLSNQAGATYGAIA